MAVTFPKPVDDDLPWEQRLANYATDRDAGRKEYQRAQSVFNAKTALGDSAGAEAARKWMDQINTATGGYASSNPMQNVMGPNQSNISKLTDSLMSSLTQPRRDPWSFNPQSNPLWQEYQRQTQQMANTQAANTMVDLGRRGIGNSSETVRSVAQIQQGATQDAIGKALPAIMEQDYRRYMDQYGMDQDMIRNLSAAAAQLFGMDNTLFQNELAQAGVTGQYRGNNTLEQRLANWNVAQQLGQQTGRAIRPTDDWGAPLFGQLDSAPLTLAGQSALDEQTQRALSNAWAQAEALGYVTPALAELTGLEVGAPTLGGRQVSLTERNTAADNARAAATASRSAQNENFNRLMAIWEATGRAPAGIPGVPEGTPLYDQVGSRQSGAYDYRSDPDFQANFADAGRSPEQFEAWLTANADQVIRDYGIEGYQALINEATRARRAKEG